MPTQCANIYDLLLIGYFRQTSITERTWSRFRTHRIPWALKATSSKLGRNRGLPMSLLGSDELRTKAEPFVHT
jgi:hypothetical protein